VRGLLGETPPEKSSSTFKRDCVRDKQKCLLGDFTEKWVHWNNALTRREVRWGKADLDTGEEGAETDNPRGEPDWPEV